MINKKSKIFVAGHKGMVGSAIIRKLKKTENIVIDPKTRLQEHSLKLYKKLPEYKYLSNTGWSL